MSRTDGELAAEATAHLRLALRYAEGDLGEQLTADAICMRLSAAIETLARLDEATRQRLFGSAWAAMWGMRNRNAHGYLLVDHDNVRATVDRDVTRILHALEALQAGSADAPPRTGGDGWR